MRVFIGFILLIIFLQLLKFFGGEGWTIAIDYGSIALIFACIVGCLFHKWFWFNKDGWESREDVIIYFSSMIGIALLFMLIIILLIYNKHSENPFPWGSWDELFDFSLRKLYEIFSVKQTLWNSK